MHGRWKEMQNMMSPLVLSFLILIASWSVSAIVSYFSVYEVIARRKKPWNEMTPLDQSRILWFSGLGGSAGVVSFILLFALAASERAFPQIDLVILFVWVLVEIPLTAWGGVLATHRKVSQNPLKEHELTLKPQDRPTVNEQL